MSYQALNFGTVVNDGTGDTLPVAADKINDNFVEIYNLLGDGSSLSSGISATSSVITLVSPTITGTATMANLDISGDVDIDGTLETDALTIAGVTLAETIADTVGAMVASNTETNITVTYDDSDNTLDFVVDLSGISSISGNAGTATALETARTIHGVSFDGTANIDLTEVVQDTVGAMFSSNTETGITVTYQDADGTIDLAVGTLNQDTTGNAATATALETARTIHGVSFDGTANIDLTEVVQDTVGAMFSSNTETNITATYQDSDGTIDLVIGTLNQDTTGNAATATALETARTIGGTSFDGTANIAVALSATATALETARTIHGVSFDGTANIDLTEVVQDTVGAMFSSNTETGITATYQDADGTIDLVIGTLNQNTTGNAATATALETARTIHGVSFDGTANIDLTEVVQDTIGAMFSSNTETGVTVTYQDADGTIDVVVGTLNQDTTGNAATATALETARTIGGTSFDGTANIAVALADTATALATARTIHGVSFDGTANIDLTEVVQDTVGAMFSSNTETNITATYQDADGTIDLVIGTLNQDTTGSAATLTTARTIGGVSFDGSANINLPGVNTAGNQDTTGTAAKVTVTDSTANTNFPVTFHDESNSLLDDTGALRYNPSTGTLLVPNLVVAGTTTQVDTVTMNAENAVIFEGATADDHETTLTIIDPTADRTQRLLNQSGYIPLLAAVTTTAITSTPEELNILDGATVVVGEINALDLGSTAVGTAIASKAVILDSNKDYTGIRNFTVSGELDAATGDFSGNVDVDGTLEADAITVNGTALDEFISDTVGAMVSSNTETGIAVTYQDADNTIDFALNAAQTTITSLLATDIKIGEDDQTKIDFETADTINFYAGNEKQLILTDGALTPGADNILDLGSSSVEFKDAYFDGTVTSDAFAGPLTGNVTGNADTATALATARTIGGVSFDGSANINLPGVNTAGNQNTSGTAAVATVATTVTITDNESTDEDNAIVFTAGGDVDGGNLGLESDGTLTYNPSTGKITATGFVGALTGDVTGDITGNAATATALETARTIHGVSFDGTGNIDLSEVIQDTVGAMFSSNTETGITVTYQDGDGTIDLVVGTLNQDTTGSAATLTTARTIGGVSFDGSANINLPGVNTAGNQNTSGTAAVATTVTITDNESTDEDNAIIFAAGGDVDGGNLGLESDGTLTYNPSTGIVTATGFAGALTGNVTGNVSGTAATVTGAAQTNITSLGTLTTLTVDNIIINGTNIGHTSDTDAIAIASNGVVTFSQAPVFPDGSINIADLDIDGATDIGADLADADLFIVDDGAGGTNRKSTLARLKSYMSAGSTVAADDINAGDAAVTITTSSGNITIDAAADDSDIILKGTDGGVDTTFLTIDGSAAGEATFNSGIVIADAGTIGSASDKDAIAIASDGVVTMNQIPVFSAGINVSGGTIAGTLSTAAQGNVTSLGTLTTLTVDNIIINGTNIGHTSDTDAIAIASNGVVTFSQAPVFPDGSIAVADLDIDGATDIGAALTDADLFIVDDGAGGTNRKSTLARLKTYIGASTSSAADDITAGDAAVTITTSSGNITIDAAANDSDIILKGTDGGADTTFLTIDGSAAGEATFNAGIVIADAGNIGSASDKDAIAIASDGVVTMNQIPVFSAGINVSGGTIAGTLSTAAQGNITSLGTLTALTVDNVVINGATIGHGDDTDLMTVADGILTVAGEVSMTTLDIGGTNVTSTAAELNVLDGITAVVGELNALDLGSTAVGTAIASKAVILDSNKDYTGIRNLTISGELDAGSLDISGNVDIDGTLEADAITVNGTTLAETISDTVGAMVGSNTETGITVTYQDADNTLDFALGAAQTTITSLLATDIKIGEDDQTKIDFETADEIHFYAANAHQVKIVDGAIVPATDNDVDLGTSSAEFKNAFFDGTVTADAFAGPINGDLTGTLQTAAQANVTSLGTLTTLTVDNVIINGTTIGHTDDTDLMTVADGILTVAGEVSMTTLDIGGTNVTSTAAELNILDGVTSTAAELNILDGATVVVGEINALDLGSTAVGNAIASKAVILDSNKDYTGLRNFTVTGDIGVGDDINLTSDSALVTFGANSEITLTHVHDVGLTVTNTINGTDNRPVVLQLKSEEDEIVQDDVIASIEMAAGDSDGTDGATVAAGIHAIAEGTFSASANATKLVFTTGVSETAASSATAKMTLSSAGLLTIADDFVIKDGGTIGVASDTDSITIASDGVVTFSQEIVAPSLDISGNVDIDGTLEADAITVNGATLAETISDTVGAMVGSNTETGITVTYQDADNTLDFALGAAQTTITSLLATDIKIGEDDQTKIDFETADEIHFYAANAHQIKLVDGALVPATDNDVDLGTSSAEFKDAYFDGTVTADAFSGPINGDLTGTLQTAAQGNVTSLGTLTTLTVDNIIINGTNIGHTSDTDSIAIASDGVVTFSQAPVFPDGSIPLADLDIDGATDIGAAIVDADLFIVDDGAGGTNRKTTAARLKTYINAGVSSAADDISAGDGAVNITTSSGDITIDAAANDSDIILKGTDGGADTTFLTIDGSAAGKATFNNEIVSGAVITSGAGLVIADAGNIGSASDTDAIAIASDGVVTMNQIPVFSAGINVSGGTIAGTLATAAQGNVTSLGTLTTLTVDNIIINGTNIGHTSDTDAIVIASDGVVTFSQEVVAPSLDISGNVDIDGTLEADAITVNGTTLAETISDTVGAMVSSNTETGIAVTYQDADNTIDFALGAAQTTITSLLATDIKIGEDDQTKIDFETADEIHFYAANAHQVKIVDGAIVPATDNDVDLGTSSAEFKNAFFDGTVTSDAFAGPLTGNVTGNADTATALATARTIGGVSFDGTGNINLPGVNTAGNQDTSGTAALATLATVTDSTANTNFPVVFHDESNALLDDTGALRYNPSSGTLLVPNLVVAGTTTQVDTVTMNAQNAVVFEGATADDHETTLTIIDPTGDRTINLPNVSGTIPVLAAASTTQVTSTPEELNILDGATVVVGEINALDLGSTAVGTAIASKAVILDSNKDYTGVRNFTLSGELDAGSLDISGNVDIDGTLEADAITVNGTALAEFISDTAGAMVSSNTETGITVTYQDADNTIDFAINAAQTTITSLLATDIKIGEDDQTKIDFETADEIHFYAANAHQIKLVDGALVPATDNDVDLGTSSAEFKDAYFDGTVTADAFAGPLTGNVTGNVSGTAATVTGAAQTNITSLGTLTALTVDNVVINGATIGHGDDTDLMTVADGILTVAGEVSMTTLDIGGTNVTSTAAELNILDGVTSTAAELNVLDGITAVVGELNALDLGSTAVGNAIASKAVILDSNKDYTGIRNFTLSGELDAGSLDVSGDVDIDGTLEADAITVNGTALAEFISDTAGAMVSSNTETGIAVTYQDADNTIDFAINAAQTTITSLLATDIKIGEDDQTKIDFETADEIHFYAANAHQVKIVDGAIVPATDNDVDLGTSSAEFKDAYFDGTVTADAFAGPINGDLTGTLQTAAQANVTSLGTLTTLTVDNIIINGTNIGHTSDTDAIAIASNGVVTFSQAPVFPDGSIAVADLDIDGATDIGAAIADADLFIVDDGAGGTNRKTTAARLKTYIDAAASPKQLLIKNASGTVIQVRVGNATTGGTDVEIQNSAGTALLSLTGAFNDAQETILGPDAASDAASLPRGYLSGMGLSNATDTDHDITVAEGEVRDNANSTNITLDSAMTKRIDATWSSGSGNGGLASGVSLGNNTWYHVHAIIVSGSVDIGFDTSVTAANLVANNSASAFRRIGAVLTDGSANILNFQQFGDEFIFNSQINNLSNGSPGTSRLTQTVSTPLGVETRAILGILAVVAGNNNGVRFTITNPGVTDVAASSNIINNGGENSSNNNGTWASGTHIVRTNTSSQVAYRQDYGAAVYINTNGYYDDRGQG